MDLHWHSEPREQKMQELMLIGLLMSVNLSNVSSLRPQTRSGTGALLTIPSLIR